MKGRNENVKTKELIKQLQEVDPSGELHACVGNVDIHFVSLEPAYWDGRQEILMRDESEQFYNIIGAKITSEGNKVQIHTLSIDDAIFNNPGLPVDIDVTNEEWEKRYKQAVLKWRREAVEIWEEIETKRGQKYTSNEYNLQCIQNGKDKIAEEENEK